MEGGGESSYISQVYLSENECNSTTRVQSNSQQCHSQAC